MLQYSRTDHDSIAGQALLRVNFATHAWPNIRKKLENIQEWQDKGLNKLLKEAQKVYVQRDEEKAKAKAKIMVATMRESNPSRNPQPPGTIPRYSDSRDKERGGNRTPVRSRSQEQMRNVCFYCREEGHYKRY